LDDSGDLQGGWHALSVLYVSIGGWLVRMSHGTMEGA